MTVSLLPTTPASLSTTPRFWALIPCAGTGSRAMAVSALAPLSSSHSAPALAVAPLPKQYQLVAGQPMVLHTLSAFAGVRRLAGMLVAVMLGDHFLDKHVDPAIFVVPCGGATRAGTVLGGLHALLARGARREDWVLVHDAARCLVTTAQIDGLIDECAHDSVGGLLAHKLADTLKASTGSPGGVRVASTVDRSDKWLAQTPQMFRMGPLIEAIEKVGAQVTDEASAMEAMGLYPRLVPGSAQNFKVTYPDDFALAAAVLAQRCPSARTSSQADPC